MLLQRHTPLLETVRPIVREVLMLAPGGFFSSDGFMPHGHCYLWNAQLIELHVVADGLIAAAYAVISLTLVAFARKRTDIPFKWMFLCFGTFIIACGATHIMEIWTLWTPSYWLSGIIKAITAAASVPTAALLVWLLPKALTLPSPQEISTANEELRKARDTLELRVQERTAELVKKNDELASLRKVEIGDPEAVRSARGRSAISRTSRVCSRCHGDRGQGGNDRFGERADRNDLRVSTCRAFGRASRDVGAYAFSWPSPRTSRRLFFQRENTRHGIGPRSFRTKKRWQ